MVPAIIKVTLIRFMLEQEATIKQNNELEAKRVASVAQAQNLIVSSSRLSIHLSASLD